MFSMFVCLIWMYRPILWAALYRPEESRVFNFHYYRAVYGVTHWPLGNVNEI